MCKTLSLSFLPKDGDRRAGEGHVREKNNPAL